MTHRGDLESFSFRFANRLSDSVQYRLNRTNCSRRTYRSCCTRFEAHGVDDADGGGGVPGAPFVANEECHLGIDLFEAIVVAACECLELKELKCEQEASVNLPKTLPDRLD